MNFLIIAILSAAAQIVAPWYVIGMLPFLIFIWNPGRSHRAFWISFAGIATPWLAYAYYLHFVSDGAISDRIASIFSLPAGILLLPVSAVVAGLVGGFSGLAGYWFRLAFSRRP